MEAFLKALARQRPDREKRTQDRARVEILGKQLWKIDTWDE